MPIKKHLATIDNNEMVNFYENKKLRELLTTYDSPCFDIHRISIPFGMGNIASSGWGKTCMILNIIHKMPDTWGHIYVCYKASEPLYEFMAKCIGEQNITFFFQLSKFPTITDLPKDCVTYPEKQQEIIKEIAIRGRKYGKVISMCYLSQSFYKIPRLIRPQFNYLIILKLGSKRDMEMIISECSLGIEKNELLSLYKEATKQKFNFLKMNFDTGNNNEKFSKNFKKFYTIEGDSESDEG